MCFQFLPRTNKGHLRKGHLDRVIFLFWKPQDCTAWMFDSHKYHSGRFMFLPTCLPEDWFFKRTQMWGREKLHSRNLDSITQTALLKWEHQHALPLSEKPHVKLQWQRKVNKLNSAPSECSKRFCQDPDLRLNLILKISCFPLLWFESLNWK